MKLLVFASTPSPRPGQSCAVNLMLEHFGGDRRKRKPGTGGATPDRFGIECYHVNARISRVPENQGQLPGLNLVRLFRCCLEAIWCHFRHGVDVFYYVPAPGRRQALYADWLVLLLCRPFFNKIIFHWHDAGLAKWLETVASIRTRSFTYERMKDADLSIVLSEGRRRDAEKLLPRRLAVVADGTPALSQLARCIVSLEDPASASQPESCGESAPGAGFQTAPAAVTLKLALTILAENPSRKTGLSTLFHELVARSLKLYPEVSWLIFAGPNQAWTVTDPRVEVVRDYPANDHLSRRIFADHFLVPGVARRRGAQALLTVGFVPMSKSLPSVLHVLSLQTLDKRNRLGILRQLYRNSMMRYNWRRADLVVTNSRWTADQVLSLHPGFRDHLMISHEGLQHEIFHPTPAVGETARLKEKLGLEPGYFLWVSNFYPYKQAELLIAAYARLDPELRRQHPLAMAGGNWMNGLENAQAQAEALGVERDIKFLGWIDDAMLAPLYRHAVAFCLASREETFGRCVIEAIACGTPCIVNDIPIMHEVTGDHALIVDFRDSPAVADALEEISRDAELVARLRAGGQAHVQQFTFEKLVTERITAIQQVVARLPVQA